MLQLWNISNFLSISFTVRNIDSLKFSLKQSLISYTILCYSSHLPRLKSYCNVCCQTNCTCYRWRMLLALPDCQFARLMECGWGWWGRVFWKPSWALRRADLRQAPRLALASNLTAECADGCDSQDKTFGSCQESFHLQPVFRGPRNAQPTDPSTLPHPPISPAALAQPKQPVTLFGCLTSSD